MKSQLPRLALAAALTAGGLDAATHAQSADAIIDKLVDKGILTVDEANELKDEADKNFTTAYSVKSGMPDWVTALKINGDFRGRFEGFYAESEGGQRAESPDWVNRDRWRYRFRLGVVANLQDNFEVGFRLTSSEASGGFGGDPISGNTTLRDNASKKFVYIDQAYGRWTAINRPELTGALTVGKMENPFVFSDIVFDGDYTPEGLAETFTYTLSSKQALKLTGGQFVLDEVDVSSKDPWLFGGQLRLESAWTPKIATSLGAAYLAIANTEKLTTAAVPDMNSGNLRDRSGSSTAGTVYGFGSVVLDGAVTYTLDSFPMYPGAFPIRVGGTAMRNLSASNSSNDGYEVGVLFGKAGKRKTWEVGYRYKVLEGDAWYEELVDSDTGALYRDLPLAGDQTMRSTSTGYRAGTNLRGHVVRLGYSPWDSLTLSATLFHMDLIEEQAAGTDSTMNRLQVDAVLKF